MKENTLLGLYGKFGRSYPAGSVIFMENEPGSEMYIIVSGKVQITKTFPKKMQIGKTETTVGTESQVLAVLGAGDFVGEMSLLNNKPRSATATVIEEAKVLVLNKTNFSFILERQPKMAIKMLQVMSNRVRELDELIGGGTKAEEQSATPKTAKEQKFISSAGEEKLAEQTSAISVANKNNILGPSSPEEILYLGKSFWISISLIVAVKLEIFNKINLGINTVEKLSEELKLNAQLLNIFLDALVSLKFLYKEEATYNNLPLTNRFLVSGKSTYLGDSLLALSNILNDWVNLSAWLSSKEGEQKSLNKKWLRQFIINTGVSEFAAVDFIKKKINLSKVKRIFETGEMAGNFSVEVLKSFPQIEGIILEQEEFAELTKEYLSQFAFGDKVLIRSGDYKTVDFGKGIDIFIFSFGFYFEEITAKSILEKAKNCLSEVGLILIYDFFYEEKTSTPQEAFFYGLTISLQDKNLRIWSKEKLQKIAAEVGLKVALTTTFKDNSSICILKKEK